MTTLSQAHSADHTSACSGIHGITILSRHAIHGILISVLLPFFLDRCAALSLPLPRTSAVAATSPDRGRSLRNTVELYIRRKAAEESTAGPLARSVLLCPPSIRSDDVIFVQRATDARIVGEREIVAAAEMFDRDYQSNSFPGVDFFAGRISTLSAQEVSVQWNVTWIPPTAAWLTAWPGEIVPTTYNHLSGEISTYSWAAVGRLIWNAVSTGRVNVPLACIEGRTVLRFEPRRALEGGIGEMSEAETLELRSITEDISYAEDLRRGALKNRRCALDLRLFLESGRRPKDVSWKAWEEIVSRCLPWETVPGSGSLDIEPMAPEEGSIPATIFLGIAAASLLVFANLVAPELIGQSLFGPPTIVDDPFYSINFVL